MRILVTGGNGFVGFESIMRLIARGDSVIALDNDIAPHLTKMASKSSRIVAVAGDITDLADLAQLFKKYKPEAVLHFAAIVGVPASLTSPSNVLRVNVQGSLNVFEAMRLFGVKRVIHLSTEEVYGDFQSLVADEEHPQVPLLPYGITKLAAEHFGRTYQDMHGLECINIRTSWVYGVRLGRPRPPMNYINAALEGRRLHIEVGGDTVIDYAYIDDLVDGVLLALDHPAHKYNTYNIASGEAVSDCEIVEHIKTLLPNADIAVGSGRREFAPGVRIPQKGALSVKRAHMAFGYTPKYDIHRGLAKYIAEWQKSNVSATGRG